MTEIKSKSFYEKLNSIYNFFEKLLFVLLIIVFFCATLLVVYGAISKFILFFNYSGTSITHIALEVADKILLALMFLEIMHTIKVHMLEENFINCVEPFLFVAIIASIRRILIISLEISHSADLAKEFVFFHYMAELCVLGILVVLFIVCIGWLRKNKICS